MAACWMEGTRQHTQAPVEPATVAVPFSKKPFSPEPWKAIVRCAYHLHHRHCTKYCSAKLLKHVSINFRLYCVMCGLISDQILPIDHHIARTAAMPIDGSG